MGVPGLKPRLSKTDDSEYEQLVHVFLKNSIQLTERVSICQLGVAGHRKLQDSSQRHSVIGALQTGSPYGP